MKLSTPQQALEQYAGVVDYFFPDDDKKAGYRFSSNASVVGGYAESLVGALFVPRNTKPNALWALATSFKTSELAQADKDLRRQATGMTGRGHDKVDLYVPIRNYKSGRWSTVKPDPSDAPAMKRLQSLRTSSKDYLTCQVKSRFVWRDLDSHDALAYSLYVNLGRTWSRQEIVDKNTKGLWRSDVPDLVAWVRFQIVAGSLVTKVRLASADDVKMAIRAKTMWEIRAGKPAALKNRWSGSKIDFMHVFGEKGWEGTDDLHDDDVKQLKRDNWKKWAVGVDMSEVPMP
jgi:hypothetical protein